MYIYIYICNLILIFNISFSLSGKKSKNAKKEVVAPSDKIEKASDDSSKSTGQVNSAKARRNKFVKVKDADKSETMDVDEVAEEGNHNEDEKDAGDDTERNEQGSDGNDAAAEKKSKTRENKQVKEKKPKKLSKVEKRLAERKARQEKIKPAGVLLV